jgi:bifunctional non-homologous end joining protein LigD
LPPYTGGSDTAIRITQRTLVSKPLHRDGWICEEKVDGWRMLAYKDGAAVKLVSRTVTDHTKRFSHIVAAIQAMVAPSLVLDGEVAVFDRALISRFE